MEIKKENKFKRNFKKIAAVGLAFVFALALALGIGLSVSNGGGQISDVPDVPVNTEPLSFGLPMADANIVKDYADDHLQRNDSLGCWEIHLSVDLASENTDVFAVCDGVVSAVTTNSLEGSVVKIEHANGYMSVYASMDDDVQVKVGDSVKKGQKIGSASDKAGNEALSGGHLHFTLFKDGWEVDPNNYLDLQNK